MRTRFRVSMMRVATRSTHLKKPFDYVQKRYVSMMRVATRST